MNDSSETLLLVELFIDTVKALVSRADRGEGGMADSSSSRMPSVLDMEKAGNSGRTTGGAFLRGHERKSSTGFGESGGSGNAHAETLGNTYAGIASKCSESTSRMS